MGNVSIIIELLLLPGNFPRQPGFVEVFYCMTALHGLTVIAQPVCSLSVKTSILYLYLLKVLDLNHGEMKAVWDA